MEEQSTVRHCLSPLELLQNVKYYFPPSDNRLSFTKEPQRCYLQSGSVGCRYLISVWPSKYLPQLKTRNPNHFLPFTKKKKLQPKSLISKISTETRHIEMGSDCLILWPRSCLRKWFWLVAVSKMKHQHGHLPSALHPLFPWFPWGKPK